MDNIEQGREDLRAWEASKPDNVFIADHNLQNVLRRYMGDAAYEAAEAGLIEAGRLAASLLDQAARIEDRIGNHPQLERWTGIGERIEQVAFHPEHDRAGRAIWGSGIMRLQAEPGHVTHQMGLFYLFSTNGEAGHMCSLTCTAGLIRVLQQVGSSTLQERFLPPLLEADYERMQHGAQFLTEVQGGSDVGANAVVAVDQGDGTWRISGEKWFCSNVNADQFLVTARPVGAQSGTKGLGLFLVPRRLDDGSINGFHLRRLKDKLGTRTLASAELDFKEAVAYQVGPLERAFNNVVELVLNTSRLMNAIACAGIMRRAAWEAGSFACARRAFGQLIASYPLVQEAVADILSECQAATASGFALAHLLDQIETGQAGEDERAVYRLLVNANKTITSVQGTEMVHRAIEVLGGNGTIESFSILPRLYRDMVVLESWEGTHNVLCLQVLRDMARYRLHEPFARFVRAQLETVRDMALRHEAQVVAERLEEALKLAERLLGGKQHEAQAHARRLVERLGHLAQAALLLAEAQWEGERGLSSVKPEATSHFVNRHLQPGYDPVEDAAYLGRLERLMASV